LEYVQIHVYYNPHTDTCTRTCVNVNAPLIPARQAVLDLPTPEGWKAELT